MERSWPCLPEDLLTVSVRDGGPGVRVVQLRGELTSLTAFRFQRIVKDELAAVPILVVLDLSKLTTLDPAGVSALVRVAHRAGEADIGLNLAGARRNVVTVPLRDAGVLELFEIDGR